MSERGRKLLRQLKYFIEKNFSGDVEIVKATTDEIVLRVKNGDSRRSS